MGTATSRAALGLAALAIVCAGCGGSGQSSSGSAGSSGSSTRSTTPTPPAAAGFAWLQPKPPPAGWRIARLPSGAELAYPASWHPIRGDAGTATAVLKAPDGRYLGYLNATPRQGDETLSNWRTFRIRHNLEEGDRKVVRLAYGGGLRFLGGHGSCVKDLYVSGTGVRYIEIACLVAGAKATTVIVGAAPPSSWAQTSATIERAISGFRT